MEKKTMGIHHITAIVGHPQENVDFYAGVLGLRLVKQTVNFDDPVRTIFILEMKEESRNNYYVFPMGRCSSRYYWRWSSRNYVLRCTKRCNGVLGK